ncbi:MAG: hypothetical protein R2754_03910 [Microthrixaceae bacterium]
MNITTRTALAAVAIVFSLGAVVACGPAAAPNTASNTVNIACGLGTKKVPVDWYFPSGTPKGLVWLQHGFTESKDDWAAFGPKVAAKGYLAMATTLPTADAFGCTVQNIGNNTAFLNNVAATFAGLGSTTSAIGKSHADAAAKTGRSGQSLPQKLAFTGHSAGGEAVLYVANRLRTSHGSTFSKLKGVVVQDPVKSFVGNNTDASLQGLNGTSLPIYALASPKYSCNADQSGTQAVIARLTTRSFHGAQVRSGAHGDIFGTAQNQLGQITCGTPQAKNTAATQTLTLGWFGDQFGGTTTEAFYPGGSTYQGLVSAGTITTLP